MKKKTTTLIMSGMVSIQVSGGTLEYISFDSNTHPLASEGYLAHQRFTLNSTKMIYDLLKQLEEVVKAAESLTHTT